MSSNRALTNILIASKLFAERAAWDFVDKEAPNFTIATLAPPLVFGPIKHKLASLDTLNTSNQLIGMFVQGKCKAGIPPSPAFIWTDVRDLALGHVLAMEKPEAGGKRFFFVSGFFSNRETAAVMHKNFPEYKDVLPDPDDKGGDYPEGGIFKVDNSQVKNILGIDFIPFEKCVVDTVKSLKTI